MRDLIPILLVAVVVLALGGVGYRIWFGDSGLNPLTIREIQGEVTHVAGGAGAPAEIGDALAPSDRLVAGSGGRAVLGLGEETQVVLEESSALRVLGEDESGVRLELEGGRIQATVRPGSGAVGVRTGDREFNAADADFQVAVDERGVALVEVDRGQAQVSGVDGVTQIGQGERLVSTPEGTSRLTGQQRSLLLQVDWPEEALTRREELWVEGDTDPGAAVVVAIGDLELPTRADPSGRFRLKVPLGEGDNALVVRVVDVLGEAQEASWSVVRDTRPPSALIEVGP